MRGSGRRGCVVLRCFVSGVAAQGFCLGLSVAYSVCEPKTAGDVKSQILVEEPAQVIASKLTAEML